MWRPIRAAGMVAQVREGRENGKGELVGWEKGWARNGFSILMSFQIVSYLIWIVFEVKFESFLGI
jgi:hypothetical protein